MAAFISKRIPVPRVETAMGAGQRRNRWENSASERRSKFSAILRSVMSRAMRQLQSTRPDGSRATVRARVTGMSLPSALRRLRSSTQVPVRIASGNPTVVRRSPPSSSKGVVSRSEASESLAANPNSFLPASFRNSSEPCGSAKVTRSVVTSRRLPRRNRSRSMISRRSSSNVRVRNRRLLIWMAPPLIPPTRLANARKRNPNVCQMNG